MPHKHSEDGWLSVTEVLTYSIPKPFLMYWYGKYGTQKCEQIKKESQQIGIKVHELIEYRFNGDISDEADQCNSMVDNFWNNFVLPYEVKPVSLEVSMKDERLKLQGTFDAIIQTNKGIALADWKTSNTLDKISVPLQLSMYYHLYQISNPDDKGADMKGVAVRIDKEKDKVDVHWYEDLKQYNPIWKACLKVARYVKFGVEDK